MWDSAVVLVSSDHSLRPELWMDERWRLSFSEGNMFGAQTLSTIPFLLKLPQQTTGFEYHHAFNTVVTPQLLIEVTRGNIRSAKQASEWLTSQKAAAYAGLSGYLAETR